MSTATLGSTYRSTLGAVSAVFDSAADTIGMGHRFIKEASTNQTKRQAANAVVFDHELQHTTTMRLLKVEDEAIEYVGNDTTKGKRYNEARALIANAISGNPSKD